MKPYTVTVRYGSGKSRADCYVLPTRRGWWYAIDGSQNVNLSPVEIEPDHYVEEIQDVDMFTWSDGVHSEEELEGAVEE